METEACVNSQDAKLRRLRVKLQNSNFRVPFMGTRGRGATSVTSGMVIGSASAQNCFLVQK